MRRQDAVVVAVAVVMIHCHMNIPLAHFRFRRFPEYYLDQKSLGQTEPMNRSMDSLEEAVKEILNYSESEKICSIFVRFRIRSLSLSLSLSLARLNLR